LSTKSSYYNDSSVTEDWSNNAENSFITALNTRINYIFTFTFSHLADAFIQSDLHLRTKSNRSSWRGNNNTRSLENTKFKHCSENYYIFFIL